MREIKFRAWDKDNKEMLYFDTLSWDDEYDNLYFNGDLHVPTYDLIFMQYTGLTDKNNKEIYEGDALKVNNPVHALIPVETYIGTYTPKAGDIYIVKWLESGYTLMQTRNFKETASNLCGNIGNYSFWNGHRSLEIIGNIYENPDIVPNS
jgi:uncharacterized phage protein (TIGR01671 family)